MNDEPHFQYHQFDRKLDKGLAALTENIAENIGHGFQIIEVDLKNRDLPEWVKTNEGIQKILLTAFPKLHVNQVQRQRAGRWAQVIELFYMKSWTESDVAQELNETVAAVRSIIRSMNRVVQGKRADGSGLRSAA